MLLSQTDEREQKKKRLSAASSYASALASAVVNPEDCVLVRWSVDLESVATVLKVLLQEARSPP